MDLLPGLRLDLPMIDVEIGWSASCEIARWANGMLEENPIGRSCIVGVLNSIRSFCCVYVRYCKPNNS